MLKEVDRLGSYRILAQNGTVVFILLGESARVNLDAQQNRHRCQNAALGQCSDLLDVFVYSVKVGAFHPKNTLTYFTKT